MGIYKLVRLYWLSGLIVTGATVYMMCSAMIWLIWNTVKNI